MWVKLFGRVMSAVPMPVTPFGRLLFSPPSTTVLLAVSMMALQLLRESYIGFPSSTVIETKLGQNGKAYRAISVTLLEMLTEVKSLHLWKANSPILSRPSGDFGNS